AGRSGGWRNGRVKSAVRIRRGREQLLRAVKVEDELDKAGNEAAADDLHRIRCRVDVYVVAAVGLDRRDLGRRRLTWHVEQRHIAFDYGAVDLLLNAYSVLIRRTRRDIERRRKVAASVRCDVCRLRAEPRSALEVGVECDDHRQVGLEPATRDVELESFRLIARELGR